MDKYAFNLKNGLSGIKNIFSGGANTFGEKVVRGLAVGAGVVAVEFMAEGLMHIISKQYHIYKSKEYYDNMLKQHPQLKQFPIEDVAKYFNSLNHFAPHVASDPLAAGAYLTQSLKKLSGEELGGPPPETYGTLVDIQKKVSDAKGNSKVGNTYDEMLKKIVALGFTGDKN